MNQSALKGKSSIKISKTQTGKAHAGFRHTDGVIMPDQEYYAELVRNGYLIEKTKHGVIITPPSHQ